MSYKLVHKDVLSIKADAIINAANTKPRENLESLRHYYCIIMVMTSWSKRGRYG